MSTASLITLGNNHHLNDLPRTLYVGNLDPQVSDELIAALFGSLGKVTNVKIIHEPGNDPYCFVEFAEHSAASNALLTMNKRLCLGKELKVNWATSPGASGPKQDTSKHYHIFVGDLSPEIETQQLREAFAPFGEISDCRVVRDPQSLKSKGYGFVSFVKKTDAETAIATMNGQWLGSRAIRTNWATRKPPTRGSTDIQPTSSSKHLSFDEVYQQSSPSNCTVYCGGILQGLSDELIQKTFSHFGMIQEIRTFKEKGYAFIKFATKEAAASAIVATHNTEIAGQAVKCSWGKETGDPSNQVPTANAVAAQYTYPFHQMGYWYAQGYPQMQGSFNPAGAAAAASNLQPIQTYPCGQYYNAPTGTSAAGFNAAAAAAAAVGMQMAWQGAAAGMPGGAGSAASAAGGQPHHIAAASHHQNPLGQGIQQQTAAMIGTHYPMQPYPN